MTRSESIYVLSMWSTFHYNFRLCAEIPVSRKRDVGCMWKYVSHEEETAKANIKYFQRTIWTPTAQYFKHNRQKPRYSNKRDQIGVKNKTC